MPTAQAKIEKPAEPAGRDPEIHVMPEKYLGAAVGAAIPAARRGAGIQAAPAAAGVRTAAPGKGLLIAGLTILAVVIVTLLVLFWPRQKAVPLANISKPAVNLNVPAAHAVATTTPAVATSTLEATGPVRNAEDSDADGLTDIEEREVYGTDPYKADTDSDGYLDGSEAYYLYNPNGIAPVLLKDSGVVKSFVSPTAGYSLLVPTPWIVREQGTNTVFTGATGEFIQLTLIEASANQDLKDWYGQNNPGAAPGDVLSFVNRTGLAGIKSPDGLGIYFKKGSQVYALTYNLAGGRVVSYRRTFEMMGNSFRLESAEIPGGNASSTNFAASGTPTGGSSTTTPLGAGAASSTAGAGPAASGSSGASSTTSTP